MHFIELSPIWHALKLHDYMLVDPIFVKFLIAQIAYGPLKYLKNSGALRPLFPHQGPCPLDPAWGFAPVPKFELHIGISPCQVRCTSTFSPCQVRCTSTFFAAMHTYTHTELFKILLSLLTLSTAFLQKASGPGKNSIIVNWTLFYLFL